MTYYASPTPHARMRVAVRERGSDALQVPPSRKKDAELGEAGVGFQLDLRPELRQQGNNRGQLRKRRRRFFKTPQAKRIAESVETKKKKDSTVVGVRMGISLLRCSSSPTSGKRTQRGS